MPIPQNAEAIWAFLLSQGFTPNAAAGILGNIEQESGGNPNEPGGGLIQILGQAGGSLTEQFTAMMNYIKTNGSVADINAHASTPEDAALYFSTKYERPNAAAANNPNREQSASDVLVASKTGNWSTTVGTGDGGGSSPFGVFSWAPDILKFFTDASQFLVGATGTGGLMWILHPGSWLRIGAFLLALILIVGAVIVFTKADEKLGSVPKIIPVPV